MLVAFVADLLAVNRRLVEDLQYRMRKIEAKKQSISIRNNSERVYGLIKSG